MVRRRWTLPLGLADTIRPGGVQQLLAWALLATLDDMLAAADLESLPAGEVRLLQAPWRPLPGAGSARLAGHHAAQHYSRCHRPECQGDGGGLPALARKFCAWT
jgi:hypothetical protein